MKERESNERERREEKGEMRAMLKWIEEKSKVKAMKRVKDVTSIVF